MIINHNLNSMNAHRNMSFNTTQTGKAMEKLSSGLRINRAGDDAAGLSISEKMRSQIRGLDQASRNAQDGISMIQTAEGALQETHSILQRMREISVQAQNDTNNSDDRQAIAQELKDLTTEIDRISKTTDFNGKKLLNGTLSSNVDAASAVKVGAAIHAATNVHISKIDVSKAQPQAYTLSATGTSLTLQGADGISQTIDAKTVALGSETSLDFEELGISFQLTGGTATAAEVVTGFDALTTLTVSGNGSAEFAIGSNATTNEKLSIDFAKYDSSTLGSTTDKLATLIKTPVVGSVVDTATKADKLTTVIDNSIKQVSEQRSKLGAAQNRLEHTINNLSVGAENLQAAESRIRDVDMAKEMMNFTKNNILNQAAQAMMSQSNQQPQAVLQLLR